MAEPQRPKGSIGETGIGRQQQAPCVGSWAPFKILQWETVTSHPNGDYCWWLRGGLQVGHILKVAGGMALEGWFHHAEWRSGRRQEAPAFLQSVDWGINTCSIHALPLILRLPFASPPKNLPVTWQFHLCPPFSSSEGTRRFNKYCHGKMQRLIYFYYKWSRLRTKQLLFTSQGKGFDNRFIFSSSPRTRRVTL